MYIKWELVVPRKDILTPNDGEPYNSCRYWEKINREVELAKNAFSLTNSASDYRRWRYLLTKIRSKMIK